MLRSILTIGGWTMASRILGFARDMLIAAWLGAGPVADAFFVALKLPNLFRRLFGEGAFNAAFIPAFAATLTHEGAAAARVLAERMATLMALWLSGLVLLGWAFMPQLLVVLAPGFEGERFTLAVELTRITFPYLLLICLTALVSGVLNGLDRFGAAAAAPVFFNLLSMASLVILTPYMATPGHALAWGVTASGVAQLALVLAASAQAGMPLLPRAPRLTPEVREVLRRMAPGLLGAGVTQLNLAVDVIIASLLPAGSVSFLYYADRVAQLPLGVIGAAVGTALLPVLTRQLRSGQRLAAHRSMSRALEVSLALSLPGAFALFTAADPIIHTLFERGAFSADAAAASSAALRAYAVGLPAFVLVKALAPAFFARGDTATPVRVGIAVVVLNLVLNLALAPVIGHVGIALATSLAAWANVVALAVLLTGRGMLVPDRRLRRAVPRLVVAAAVMAAVLIGLETLFYPAEGVMRSPWRLAALGAMVAGGAVSYFGTTHVLGALDLRDLLRMLRRKK